MHLHAGAVQRERLQLDPHQPPPLQLLEHPVQHAVLRPPVHARVDRVPVAEPGRQAAPFAAVLGHMQDRVEHLQVRQADVAALHRETRRDHLVLFFGEFHSAFPGCVPRMISNIST